MVLNDIIVLNPTQKHEGTVIFLHGLGDSAHGWEDVFEQLQQYNPNVKFILPTAPVRNLIMRGGISNLPNVQLINSIKVLK